MQDCSPSFYSFRHTVALWQKYCYWILPKNWWKRIVDTHFHYAYIHCCPGVYSVSPGLVQLAVVWFAGVPAAESPVCAKHRRWSTHQHTASWPHHSSVASTSLSTGPETSGVEFKIACLVHQSLASTAPTYMYLSADIQLIPEHGRPHLRSSSHRTLVVPRTHTSFWDRSFAAAGPCLWNTAVYVTTDDQLRTV